MRRALLATIALTALLAAGEAGAQSFGLTYAGIQIEVEDDGSLQIEEQITFAFEGRFTGAYREIPLRDGESISELSVEEEGRRYTPGAAAEIGSEGEPDTYGIAQLEDAVRIVWHYRAYFEPRVFTIRYRLSGLAVAYDDVVDVNLQVWGDQWKSGLGQLRSVMVLPGEGTPTTDFRVFGHPAWVSGRTFKTRGRGAPRGLRHPC